MKITDMETEALRVRSEMAATNSIKNWDARMAALRAIRPAKPHERVSVGTVIPQRRTVYRRDHVRFQYYVDGKLVSRDAAAAALAA